MSGSGGEIERSVEVLGPELHERRRRSAAHRGDDVIERSVRLREPTRQCPGRRFVDVQRLVDVAERWGVMPDIQVGGEVDVGDVGEFGERCAVDVPSDARGTVGATALAQDQSARDAHTSHIRPELGSAEPSRRHPQTDRVGACLVAGTGDDVHGHPLQRVACVGEGGREFSERCHAVNNPTAAAVLPKALHQVPGTWCNGGVTRWWGPGSWRLAFRGARRLPPVRRGRRTRRTRAPARRRRPGRHRGTSG